MANAGKISSFEKKQMDDINYIPPEALEQAAQQKWAEWLRLLQQLTGAKKTRR